ncbi:MAG: methylmalonyl Co-A mutase-associated GTPase MeaB [Bdellovibrionia bacterium]
MSDEIGSLLEPKKRGDFKSLARLLTLLEEIGPLALKNKRLLEPEHAALRIGITGPPGAGKSTLISELIAHFRKQNKSVGVLAVDPSSPFTRGAVLGDRIRYHEHFQDEKVFIRSVGTRGSLGGLSAAIYLMARAFDAFGFDILLVETVGVGQTELEVMNVADRVAVVVVPEFGDSIQAMKAGILEIAHVFVVNKADRPGADAIATELKTWAEKPVVQTIALEKKGVAELAALLSQVETGLIEKHRNDPQRLQAEARALVRMAVEKSLENRFKRIRSSGDIPKLISDLTLRI